MRLMLCRRSVLVGVGAVAVSAQAVAKVAGLIPRIIELERKNGGRLGVAILDTKTGRLIHNRGEERFAMCSTFKFLASACVLSRVDKGLEQLDRRVRFTEKDLLPNSPVSRAHVVDDMTIGDMCEATITLSDNTAGNLLLASIGGPTAFTAYARSLGDAVTRLDRYEPELNDVKDGDERDTTSPLAALETMRKVVLGDVLSPASRDLITKWIVATKTGDKRLRAGVPKGWKVGDKTGTADAIANDIAVFWPPKREPLLAAVYYSGATKLSGDQRAAVIADVGAVVASMV